MPNGLHFQPVVSADRKIPEFTFQAVLLGSILAIVLGAANVYLGLYAGMTVSASIPAAVISMAILRGVLRRGTILENNMVQTIASSGEALAAGIIFTVPALVITEAWHEFYFWPTTLIALTGGLLGILFMIPLRRALIIEEPELHFPEGVACAEILKVGEENAKGGGIAIFLAILLGGAYKFLSSGLGILKGGVEWAWASTKSVFFFGSETSLALLAVGYIVGTNVGFLIFMGGALGWIIGIPLYTTVYGMPEGEPLDVAWTLWSTQIRYVGVGAMALGGIATIFNCRVGIEKGLQKIFSTSKTSGVEIRTEQDLRRRILLPLMAVSAVLVFFLYQYMTQNTALSLISSMIMIIASFFFVAVASYIVGLVGSSNSPISGMTICALLFASAIVLLFGFSGKAGVIAVLGIAGVVCCAACSANDICQDLKTGYLVGATPRKQQFAEILGAIIPTFFFAPILTILHTAYGIGTPVREGVKPLVAPQAMLFSKLTEAFFLDKGEIPWNMVWIGAVLAAIIIFLDVIQKRRNSSFRLHVMAVAIGIYLPLSLSTPIFIGGLLHRLVSKKCNNDEGILQKGVLIASGLIAGEALMGILVAILIFVGLALPFQTGMGETSAGVSAAIFVAMILLFMKWTLGKKGA